MQEPVKPGLTLAGYMIEANNLEAALIANAESNGGELDPALDAFLADIEKNVAEKVDAYKFVIDRLEMSAAMLDEQANRFYAASKSVDNACSRVQHRIKEAMTIRGVDEVKGTNWRFKLQNTQGSLHVKGAVPAKYIKPATLPAGSLSPEESANNWAAQQSPSLNLTSETLAYELGFHAALRALGAPDAKALRAALMAGEEIEGVELVKGHSLRAYVRKAD